MASQRSKRLAEDRKARIERQRKRENKRHWSVATPAEKAGRVANVISNAIQGKEKPLYSSRAEHRQDQRDWRRAGAIGKAGLVAKSIGRGLLDYPEKAERGSQSRY